MVETQISRMTSFDSEIIRELFEKAGVTGSEPNPEFFKNDRNIMLVARTGGELSGFLWAYVLASPDRSQSKMHLYSIDTFPPFRRRGIGTLLIQRLKELARGYDCYKMFLGTSRDNLPAMALYRKTGGVSADDGKAVAFEYNRESLNG